MKDFSPAQGPVFTFFSAPFYRDLLLNGKGMGFIYLFLLLVLCWGLETVKVCTSLQGMMADKNFVAFVDQVPEHVDYKGGKLQIDKPSPYVMKWAEVPVICIDTSGKITEVSQAEGAPLLITADNYQVAKQTGAVETGTWDKIFTTGDFSFNKAQVREALTLIVPWGTGFFVALWPFAYVGHLIAALIYGAIGLIMDSRKLGYAAMVRLASFAMTPSILIALVQFLIGFTVPFYGVISIPITIGYIWFGNNAAKGETPDTSVAA